MMVLSIRPPKSNFYQPKGLGIFIVKKLEDENRKETAYFD